MVEGDQVVFHTGFFQNIIGAIPDYAFAQNSRMVRITIWFAVFLSGGTAEEAWFHWTVEKINSKFFR